MNPFHLSEALIPRYARLTGDPHRALLAKRPLKGLDSTEVDVLSRFHSNLSRVALRGPQVRVLSDHDMTEVTISLRECYGK